jgi:hypothetical protein
MADTIWKFPLSLGIDLPITMPAGAQVLTAQVQNDRICLWALVDPSLPKELRYFEVLGTGQEFPHNERAYIPSLQIGNFVWHIFEKL